MKKIVGVGLVLMLVSIGILSGCIETDDVLESLLETTDKCYKITWVTEYNAIYGTNWSKMRVDVVDTCLGLKQTYYCRFNRENHEIIWHPELTNDSWIRVK